jgi:hypothetical protein
MAEILRVVARSQAVWRMLVVELRGGLEGDRVAQGLELLDEVGLVPVMIVTASEPITAKVVVVAVVAQQVPGDHQDLVADGDHRLLADASGQPPKLGSQVGVAAAGGGPGAFGEDIGQPAVALGGRAGAALAATDVVAWASGPPRRPGRRR